MKIAFLFSGQGSQFVSMGKNLNQNHIAFQTYNKIEKIVGIPIWDITQKGPEEKLAISEITQLAIVSLQIAILSILKSSNIKSNETAGLSLGEYSALYNAEVLSFDDLFNIVKARGQIMESFSKKIPKSLMQVVLGLDEAKINAIIKKLQDQDYQIGVANYNLPKQQVIGGTKKAIGEFNKLAKNVKVLPLNVSVPSHTPLMEPTKKYFEKKLNKINYNSLKQVFYSNISGEPTKTKDIKNNLLQQLTNSTHIKKTIINMIENNVSIFVEIGPKKVISSFIKKIALNLKKDVKIYNAYDLDSTNNVISKIKEIKNNE